MKNYIQTNLGNKIRKLRKIKGYSQESFAEKIGIATNTLSSIETGNAFMTAQTLEKISAVLDVSCETLFAFSDTLSKEDKLKKVFEIAEVIKNDAERLDILYNVAKSLL